MNGKAPTRRQKLILEENGLDHKAYVILRELLHTITLCHRKTGEITVVEK